MTPDSAYNSKLDVERRLLLSAWSLTRIQVINLTKKKTLCQGLNQLNAQIQGVQLSTHGANSLIRLFLEPFPKPVTQIRILYWWPQGSNSGERDEILFKIWGQNRWTKYFGPTCPFMSTVSGETPAQSCVKAPLGGGQHTSLCFQSGKESFKDHRTHHDW